ncbi:hypothetical protein ACSFA3_19445 [Variovorax sp. RHLX14]|uniref:hypothetical protein n=1 Tax=Variovorax sp. RHLX14 TaxID=1259731 RepID=UPI003F4464D6
MPSHQAIDRFTLAFHREAVVRLRDDRRLLGRALAVIDRWEASGLSSAGRPYRDEWRTLLGGDLGKLEQSVCVETDHAATLRNMSPLGFVLDDAERLRIRREAMYR